MIAAVVEELTRVVAYGGIGMLLGYVIGVVVNDRHRLVTTVLNEAETDVPTRRRLLSSQSLQSLVVIAVMVAMLLTGVVWLQTARENAEQDRAACLRTAAVSAALKERTRNYLESARAEREWLRDLNRALRDLGAPADGPLIASLNEYRATQSDYLEHLRRNPYPQTPPREC